MLNGNTHMVGSLGVNVVITNPPPAGMPMTKEDALEFAAYIVAVAEDPTKDGEFERVLEAVRNT